jgi:anti-sigma B factor antagonist
LATSGGFPGYQLFAVDVSYNGTEVVLALRGELDFWTKPQFVAALELAQAREVRVVLDLTELSFIDATNIGVIHQALKLASMRGTQLVLRAPSKSVLRILELTGLGPAVSTSEELVAGVAQSSPYAHESQFQQA